MKSEKIKNLSQDALDFCKDLVIIVIIVQIILTFFVMNFQIKWQSMYSSYYDREFIIVDRLSYRLWDIERWDVIVFRPNVSEEKEYFLKRIIAVPWDVLKIDDWNVYIKKWWSWDYVELDEPYLNQLNKWFTFVNWTEDASEYVVPAWSYFVMWDNRNHSTDSRTCFSRCSVENATNFVSKKNIIWKVLIDLGYFNFRNFSFTHPNLWIETKPRWFSSPDSYEY